MRKKCLCRWWKKPVVHFLLFGALLNLAIPGTDQRHELTVSRAQVAQAVQSWEYTYGSGISEAQKNRLIQNLVRETLLVQYAREQGLMSSQVVQQRLRDLAIYTELVDDSTTDAEAVQAARKLHLDQSDPVIRQYLANAGELYMQYGRDVSCCSEEEIRAYYQRHRDEFVIAGKWDISHIYISDQSDKGKLRAKAILENVVFMEDKEAIEQGDVFYGGHLLSGLSFDQLKSIFGAGFTDPAQLDKGMQWSGPVRSAYGWHIVKAMPVSPARVKPLAEIRGQIVRRLTNEKRRQLIEAELAVMRYRYRINIDSEV